MLYLFIGQQRNGKTISVVCEAKRLFELGYVVYSNIHLKFKYIPLTRKDILDFEKKEIILPPKTLFIIDEMHGWFDSRNSAHSSNKLISYFMSQLGHFTSDKREGLIILGTSQKFSFIDIRGRYLVHKIIECSKVSEKEDEYIKVLRVHKLNDNLNLKTVKKEVVIFDKEDFNLYDTQQQMRGQYDDKPAIV